MIFNEHSNLRGQHAFLGASKFHWLNYDDETLIQRYKQQYSAQMGTVLHQLASDCIKNHIRLSKSQDRHLILIELTRAGIPTDYIDINTVLDTLVPFVNDAIGFKMRSEQILYYSDNCFGCADTISFRDNVLRIHDYKSGSMPAHMEQLMIYSGLFCLEYNIKPYDIRETELRIYQNAEILYHRPEAGEIIDITKRIVESDNLINNLNTKVVAL